MKNKLFGVAVALLIAGEFLVPRISFASEATNSVSQQRYKIAVCDWMILKRQKLGAFQLAKDIGADGVEVDMGSLGTNDTFQSAITTNAEMRQQFLDKARELNLEISSLAMSGFYAQSFAERPTVPRMTQDCIDTMKAMDVKIAFLPLGVRSDLVKHPELRSKVVERLKIVGAQAEKAGVIIGVETELAGGRSNQIAGRCWVASHQNLLQFFQCAAKRARPHRRVEAARQGPHLPDSLHRPGRRVATGRSED